MMSKQVLSIEQMQHLQELGLELKDTMIYWSKPHKGVICRCGNDWFLSLVDDKTRNFFDVIPAYTLQDVLDLLPYKTVASYLHIGRKSFSGDILFYVEYSNFGGYAVSHFRSESLIQAAYEMLCWCIENKFVETNKV